MGHDRILADKVCRWVSASPWIAAQMKPFSLAFTPIYGRWSDIFGRKVVLICSLSVFFAFSLACALSQTMIQVRACVIIVIE